MSDPNPQPNTETQGNPESEATVVSELGDAGKKALDAMKAERNTAKQQAAVLQAQLDAINQANETALDKAQREATEAREQATQATASALRFRIAAESGITDNVDLILTGADEDTMRAQAALWNTRGSAGVTQPGPRPDLSQGSKGADAGSSDPAVAFGNFLTAQRAR